MVAQATGVSEIKRITGCTVFSNKVFGRGISDYFPIDQINQLIDLMKKMEAKVSREIEKKDLSLGYEKSEALVCLTNRSPNNTFPIFWYETNTKMSPFPRERIFKRSSK